MILMVSLGAVLQSIVSGILLGGIYTCFGIGISLIWGVMRVGNFAHGAIAFLGTYFLLQILRSYSVHPFLAMLLLPPLFFLLGTIIYRAIIHPAYRRVAQVEFEMATMLLTFGLSLMLESLMSFFWGTDVLTIPLGNLGVRSFKMGPIFVSGQGIIALALALASIALISVFLERTYTGIAIRATSQEREVAVTMGVNIYHIWLISFGITVALACMAGMVMSLLYAFYPQGNLLWNIKAFIVVTLGGIGSIGGTLAGGLLLGVCENLATTLLPLALRGTGVLPGGFRDVVALAMFLILLLFRPRGLFGRR